MVNLKASSERSYDEVGEKTGIVYVSSTKKNTLCTLVDPSERKVKTSCSVGVAKEGNREKKDSYAEAARLGQALVERIHELGYARVSVVFRGLGTGRSAIMSGLQDSGIAVDRVTEVTMAPHNGCRPPKARRKKFRTKVGFEMKKSLSSDL